MTTNNEEYKLNDLEWASNSSEEDHSRNDNLQQPLVTPPEQHPHLSYSQRLAISCAGGSLLGLACYYLTDTLIPNNTSLGLLSFSLSQTSIVISSTASASLLTMGGLYRYLSSKSRSSHPVDDRDLPGPLENASNTAYLNRT